MSNVHMLRRDLTLFHGDMREVLRVLPDNFVDAVVTDPPYHLTSVVKRFGADDAAPARSNGPTGVYARSSAGFMGKRWDGGDIAFQLETWREIFRVLKPGGHLLAMGGTRTYHRLACAIEDAGFEVRDMVAYLYGVGFPKSLDVSKQLDRAAGAEREKVAPRSVIGHQRNIGNSRPYMSDPNHMTDSDIPATDAAREWQGWGTALKPAIEPTCLARKPLSEATVAANVLRWGTGALNIDGCRVKSEKMTGWGGGAAGGNTWNEGNCGLAKRGEARPIEGRWPANVIHDGSVDVLEAFPQSKGQLAAVGPNNGSKRSVNVYGDYGPREQFEPRNDCGSAARFFFNVSNESDTEWLAQNLPNDLANDAALFSTLDGVLAATVLKNAVAQSMPPSGRINIDYQEPFTSVTLKELKKISETVIEMILSLGRKCLLESLPRRLSQSDSRVSIVAIQERIGTITIMISRLKSNGCAGNVTLDITQPYLELGVADCANRFHYSAKASKSERAGSKHPTVKPIALKAYFIRLITPPGGIVLDPFAGTGTTGAAALQEGKRCLLIEREDEYAADIQRRFTVDSP